MIKRIEDMPNGAIGLEAVGTVTAEDYDNVLRPAVEAALAAGHVRLLYVLGDDFDAYSASGVWADTRLWAGHLSDWTKCAIVTNHRWVHDGIKAFAWMMPGQVRTYEPADLQAAKAWVGER